MECTVDWVPTSGMAFVAETGSGHLLTMDGAPDGGGRNLAPRPMETFLAGAGACAAYDVVLILQRGRHAVSACRVKLDAERATSDPKVFAIGDVVRPGLLTEAIGAGRRVAQSICDESDGRTPAPCATLATRCCRAWPWPARSASRHWRWRPS